MRLNRLTLVVLVVTAFWGARLASADVAGSWTLTDSSGSPAGTAVVSTNGFSTVTGVLLQSLGSPDIYFTPDAVGDLVALSTGTCKTQGGNSFVLSFLADVDEMGATYWVYCTIRVSGLSLPLGSAHGTAVKNCPNGVLDPGEECDDGNPDPGDCCFDCKLEPSCACDEGVTQLGDSDADGVPDVTDRCPHTYSHLGVDSSGCSIEQFCARVDATTAQGRKDCPKLDWNNDEPRLKRNSRDCRVDHGTLANNPSDDRCVPAVTAPCLENYADCDRSETNGCEMRTDIDPLNCGACGSACPAAPSAQPACLDAACGLLCDAGSGNCDGNATNGCETDVTADEANCGACGNVCNGSDPCQAGVCGCPSGLADCDGNPATPCETNLVDNPAHCGSCGSVCGPGERCFATYCHSQVKLIFLSSASYDGNLGGVVGADSRCNGLAAAAGLTGTYRAWLSEFGTSDSAASRLTHSSLPYLLPSGSKVADDWNDMTDGTLDAPIVADEYGSVSSMYGGGAPQAVWTGTQDDGVNGGLSTCAQWTSATSSDRGRAGDPWVISNPGWTDSSQRRCASLAKLYCVEQ